MMVRDILRGLSKRNLSVGLLVLSLVSGAFVLTGVLKAVTGDALSALILVFTLLITVVPWFRGATAAEESRSPY